jgi:hypothetical protein
MSPFQYLPLPGLISILDVDLKNGNFRLELHGLELHLAGDKSLARGYLHGEFWSVLKDRREEELSIQMGEY